MIVQTENNSNILRKYPFSLLDMDGSSEMWKGIYIAYIDLIENKINLLKNDSISIVRNFDFALNNEIRKRIAALVIIEVEEKISNPVSKTSTNILNKSREKIEDQYTDDVEKENLNLKITFVFTNRKLRPLKLIQMLKLSEEVKRYTQLLHLKKLKQYSNIIPQIIFISLFGFETTVEGFLRNNLHGKLNRNISTMVVPPIDDRLWNNYLIETSKDNNKEYEKRIWGLTFDDYKALKNNGTANQIQVKKMETYYSDLKESKEISDYNFHQLDIWADILSIKNSSTIMDLKNSRRMMIEEQVIE
ncbi:MAG: hypothetical protein KGD58_12020 [Candidatus Lokiarchaeota archaeon]|nr:hypothetical protein [Candidatus Lokiarchaeota archaeon]